MRNLTLRMKLIAGFGCLVFVLIVMAAAAYLSVSRLAESAREFDSVVHREDLVRHMETGLEKTMNGLRGFVLVGNEDLLNHYEEGRREYQESADEISRLLTTTEGKNARRESIGTPSTLGRPIQLGPALPNSFLNRKIKRRKLF